MIAILERTAGIREQGTSRRRLLLLVVAGLVSAVAALAIGILLFGDFGSTEGRILATTALLAGYTLLVVLQPILVRARPSGSPRRLRIVLASGEAVELTVEGGDLAAAVAKAIRRAEGDGRRVLAVEVADAEAAGSSAPQLAHPPLRVVR